MLTNWVLGIMVLSPVYLTQIDTNMDCNPTDKYNGFIYSMDIWIEYEERWRKCTEKVAATPNIYMYKSMYYMCTYCDEK